MPILYACLINSRRQIVFEGSESKYKSQDYKDQITLYYPNFTLFSKNTIQLDEKLALHYQHEGSYAITAISLKPDVTLYEAFNFLDKLKEGMSHNGALSDITLIQQPNASFIFKDQGKEVSKFIQQWNADPQNRDKTYIVFQELLQTKDEMLDNIIKLTERDLLLDQCINKTQTLESQAKILRSNARKTNQQMKRRRCGYCFIFGLIAAVVIVGIILVLTLWVKVF